MVKVSIVVPVYNVEEYIEKCIVSILNQTMKDIEIILVNDGTKDSSGEICKKYRDMDSRIIYIEQENAGLAAARQNGIDHATGEYLYSLDSDDYIEPDLCERVYSEAVKNDADIVFFNCIEHIKENGKEKLVYKEKYLENKLYDRDAIIKDIIPRTITDYDNGKWTGYIRWCTWLRFFKKSFIDENNIKFVKEFRRKQDLPFTFETTLKAQRYLYLGDDYLYHQNYVPTSLSKKYNADLWELSKPMIEYLDEICSKVDFYDIETDMALCALTLASGVLYNRFTHPEHMNFRDFYKVAQDKILDKYKKIIRKNNVDISKKSYLEFLMKDNLFSAWIFYQKHFALTQMKWKITGSDLYKKLRGIK